MATTMTRRLTRHVERQRARAPRGLSAATRYHAIPKHEPISHARGGGGFPWGPVLLGAGALAVAGVFLVPAIARAATPEAPPPAPPGPPGPPGPGGGGRPTGATQIVGTASGDIVPGPATVVGCSGVNLRTDSNVSAPSRGLLRPGTVVQVTGSATPDGWVPVIVNGQDGFVCNDCRQLNDSGSCVINASLKQGPTG